MARHPGIDMELVIDPRRYGSNAKVSNLINMAEHAKHGVLVLSDSDIAVPRDYLTRVVGALLQPGIGAVTCPYTGRAGASAWSTLAAMGTSYDFLPNMVFGSWWGVADACLGSTIALRRATLDQIGGFDAFANYLADDYEIGRAIAIAASGSASCRSPSPIAAPKTPPANCSAMSCAGAARSGSSGPGRIWARSSPTRSRWRWRAWRCSAPACSAFDRGCGAFGALCPQVPCGKGLRRGCRPRLADAGSRHYIHRGFLGLVFRPEGGLARQPLRGRGLRRHVPIVEVFGMKSLFLQAPSFDGYDGGAGARYQMKREVKSFWFPTWLAQAAAMVPAPS